MNIEINLTPSLEEEKSFGILAHVDAAERQRMLALAAGRKASELQALERRIDAMKKRKGHWTAGTGYPARGR